MIYSGSSAQFWKNFFLNFPSTATVNSVSSTCIRIVAQSWRSDLENLLRKLPAWREDQHGNIKGCGRGVISKIAGQAGMDGRKSMYLRSRVNVFIIFADR